MYVLALPGASTTGKSTICSKMEQDHQWIVISQDEVFGKMVGEHSKKMEAILSEELSKANLINKLQPFLTEEALKNLCDTGLFSTANGDFKHQFSQSPTLDEIHTALTAPLAERGYSENEINDLCKNLFSVAELRKRIFDEHPLHTFEEGMDRLYDEAYRQDPQASIILDFVPDPRGSMADLLEQFEKRAQKYRSEHGAAVLTTSVILAYCPPQVLSERQKQRNLEAEKSDPGNKRLGIFPYEQLSKLVEVDEKKAKKHELGSLSNNEVLELVRTHSRANASTDTPLNRLGIKMQEYKQLARQFGLWNHKHDSAKQIPLHISNSMKIDGLIDTSKNDPSNQLLNELQRIEKSRSASIAPQKLAVSDMTTRRSIISQPTTVQNNAALTNKMEVGNNLNNEQDPIQSKYATLPTPFKHRFTRE